MMHAAIIHAEEIRLHVTTIKTDLETSILGDNDLETRTVRVQRDLPLIVQECTIMHELGHIALRHVPTGDPEHDRRIEQEADEWAAERLIPEAVFTAARTLKGDLRDWAEQCHVDERTIKARIAMAERTRGPEQRTLILPAPAGDELALEQVRQAMEESWRRMNVA